MLPFPARAPEVRVVSFFTRRAAFTFPVETYPDWVLLGCTEGAFDFSIGDEPEQPCEPGQFVLCPPGRPLVRTARGEISFWFIRFRWPGARSRPWSGRHDPRDQRRLRSTLDHLYQLRDDAREPTHARWASHLVSDLLHQSAHERTTTIATPRLDQQMLRAAELLGTNLRRNDSIEQIAVAIEVEPWQLSRRFKRAYGVSPVDYRTAARLQEAKRLLTETTSTLQVIAVTCGYDSAFYFSRVFKRMTGQSPGRYRNTRRV